MDVFFPHCSWRFSVCSVSPTENITRFTKHDGYPTEFISEWLNPQGSFEPTVHRLIKQNHAKLLQSLVHFDDFYNVETHKPDSTFLCVVSIHYWPEFGGLLSDPESHQRFLMNTSSHPRGNFIPFIGFVRGRIWNLKLHDRWIDKRMVWEKGVAEDVMDWIFVASVFPEELDLT